MKDQAAARLQVVDITSAAENLSSGKEMVTLHFCLALDNGEVVDSNFEREPVTFSPGDGNLPGEFENFVQGLAIGEKRSVTIPPEKAFGLINEENIRVYPHYQFPADMALETGLVVTFADSAGNEQAGVIAGINRQQVTVDFNHPLAGKSVIFTALVTARSVSDE